MPLQLEQLEVGDVLLKQKSGGVIQWVIATATNSSFIHAAMYMGDGKIAESLKQGFIFNPLMNGEICTYEVYRYVRDGALSEIAAMAANTLVLMHTAPVGGYRSSNRNFGTYSWRGAIGGAVRNMFGRPGGAGGEGSQAWEGAIASSYCSQFVVQAYNAAGATWKPPVVPLDVAAGRATPAILRDKMRANGSGWKFLDVIVAR